MTRTCPQTDHDRLRADYDRVVDEWTSSLFTILRLESEKRALLAANDELQRVVQALVKQPLGPRWVVRPS